VHLFSDILGDNIAFLISRIFGECRTNLKTLDHLQGSLNVYCIEIGLVNFDLLQARAKEIDMSFRNQLIVHNRELEFGLSGQGIDSNAVDFIPSFFRAGWRVGA
jgi:tetrahydromethanopterin S-methyltransferase subunit F